jgi:hypothetical protein
MYVTAKIALEQGYGLGYMNGLPEFVDVEVIFKISMV